MAARDPAAGCPEKEASVSAQSLPSLLGKERSPGACGDLIDSPARHRPGAQRSRCCRWLLPLLLLCSHSSLGSPPRGTVIHQLLPGLVLSELPVPRQGDCEIGCSCCQAHAAPQTQHWAGSMRSWGNGPLPPPQQLPLPCLVLRLSL